MKSAQRAESAPAVTFPVSGPARAASPRTSAAWPYLRARTPTTEMIAYLALIVLALGLRLYRVEVPSLRGDEAFGFFFA